MVKRYCVLYPDGSVNVMTHQRGEAAAFAEARTERDGFNKGEKNPTKLAMCGSIDINLQSFKELR